MKKLLIVVDYQNDFVSGSLGFEEAKSLEKPIAEKIKKYRADKHDIAFTFDTHHPDYLSTQEGKNLPITHCIEGTEGWELFGEIADLKEEGDLVFKKPSFGCSELFSFLCSHPYQSVELVGVVSNICVLSNAVLVKTALPESDVIVDASCTSGGVPALHQAALDVLEGLQIQVINR